MGGCVLVYVCAFVGNFAIFLTALAADFLIICDG